MREDMDKVIVERPRRGSRMTNDFKGEGKLRQRAMADVDLLPRRASTARLRRKGTTKDLNEHLGPLRRFLNARVGQHWSKVYAEVRQRINPDSTQQMHILQHLVGRLGYVETDVRAWPDGSFTDAVGKPIWAGWFVNPKTGCLQKNLNSSWHGGRRTLAQWWPYYNPRRQSAPYVVRDGKSFREINGVWYEIDLRPIAVPAEGRRVPGQAPRFPDVWPEPRVFDVILHAHPTCEQLREEHGGYVYAAAKRQLCSREIRRHGLRPQVLTLPDSPTRR